MDVGLGCRPVLGDEGGIVVYTVEVFGRCIALVVVVATTLVVVR